MEPVQSRMARAALGWSLFELADRAGIGSNTANRFEQGGDARMSSVRKIREAFEAEGIEFVNGAQIGVLLKPKT